MVKKISNYSVTSLAILVLTMSFLSVYGLTFATWNNAPSNPPQNNTEPPLNTSDVNQVKSGSITASSFTAPNGMRSLQYCDLEGENCIGGVPMAGDVGSLVWAIIMPTAPVGQSSNQISGASSGGYGYGDQIEGIHLCPAGFYLTGGNSNNLAHFTQSASNNCTVTLTGTYQVLGYVPTKSTHIASRTGVPNITLFQKISHECGDDLNSQCATSSLNGHRAIVNFVYIETGQMFDRIYNSPRERNRVCAMLSPGSSVQSFTTGSFGQPGNNNVGRYINGNWVRQYPATNFNNWLDSIVCS